MKELEEILSKIEEEREKYKVSLLLEFDIRTNEKKVFDTEEDFIQEIRFFYPKAKLRKKKEREPWDSGEFDYFVLLGHENKEIMRIAYECPYCKKIITGVPEIRPFFEQREMVGEIAMRYSCHACKGIFYEKTISFL